MTNKNTSEVKLELSHVEIVFENVDFVTIKTSNIEQLSIENISESKHLYNQHITNSLKCEQLHLVLKNQCKNQKTYFQENYEEDSSTLFLRMLKYNDIVNIELHYKNGTQETIYVPYDGNEENKNQKTYIDEQDNLVVEINKENNCG